MVKNTFPRTLLSEEESQYIIEVSPNQKAEQQNHPRHLCVFHKFITRFATGNDFIEQEQDVSAVQRRNRQNIHKSKDDRQECRHIPELMPIPGCREDASDGSETAQLFSSLF